jgi:hypothetical protein
VLCKHEVTGSIPVSSTSLRPDGLRLGMPVCEGCRAVALAKAELLSFSCFRFAVIDVMATQEQVRPRNSGTNRFQEPQGSAFLWKREGLDV